MIINTKSYPRAALLGNPSDGFFGKTIAFPFSNFHARVTLYETPELELLPAEYDSNVFSGIRDLAEDVTLYGYYGGIRLLKAAVKRFYEYCTENGHSLSTKNFTLRYYSDIPYRLGLAGSSAIITACMKALMKFYKVSISRDILPNLIRSVEADELGIAAGLQDRVVQSYEQPVYMDFSKELIEDRGYGRYEPMDKELFHHLYIAYRTDLSEGSEVVHNNFRERFEFEDKQVLDSISQWKELTDRGREAIEDQDFRILGQCIDENFNIRRSVMNLSKRNIEMVEAARSVGASAKFTGSGGAIIGIYRDEKMYDELNKVMEANDIQVIKPVMI